MVEAWGSLLKQLINWSGGFHGVLLGIESFRAGLDVPKQVRQADEANSPDLSLALETVGAHWRPKAVGRAGKDQLI